MIPLTRNWRRFLPYIGGIAALLLLLQHSLSSIGTHKHTGQARCAGHSEISKLGSRSPRWDWPQQAICC